MAKHLLGIVALILLLVRVGFSEFVLGNWSQWSKCYCNGMRERTRECFNTNNQTTPEKDCDLLDRETMRCFADQTSCLSGLWNAWSEWTICSESCSNDTRIRVRNCTNVVNHATLADDCDGNSVDSGQCPQINCPVVSGVWNSWSEWSNCTESCGNNVRIRARNCTNFEHTNKTNDCHGESVESFPCPEINCSSLVMTTTPLVMTTTPLVVTTTPLVMTTTTLDVWNAWSEWTICSESCSNGTRIRVRNCTNFEHTKLTYDCPGQSVESVSCPQINCPGVWNPWSEWTNCTESCVNNIRIRVRNCTNMDHTNLTNDCLGPSVEFVPCPVITCTSPVMTTTPQVMTTTPQVMITTPKGVWNSWSEWTNCTEPCSNDARIRLRYCFDVNGTHIENDCHGHSVENLPCPQINCPVSSTAPETVTIAPGSLQHSTTPSESHNQNTNTGLHSSIVSSFIVGSTTTPATVTIAPGSIQQSTNPPASLSSTTPETITIAPGSLQHSTTPSDSNSQNSTHVTATNTSPVTLNATQPQSISCYACTDDPSDCVNSYELKTCTAPNNYCINELTNNADASISLIRRCGNYDECVNDWWQTYSDNDQCKNYDESVSYPRDFYCKYCCVKDGCNLKIYPPKETNFVKN